jgi:hypothetical protein
MSELVTAHDPKKSETADRETTHVVIFPNSKKISKLDTIPQTAARAARRAAEEEERACKPLIFSHFRR